MTQIAALIVFGIVASASIGGAPEGFRTCGGLGSPSGPSYPTYR